MNLGAVYRQITAAGKVPPAKVMLIGAGVAVLRIGAANSTGALSARLTVLKSRAGPEYGAEFLELDFKEEAGSGDGHKVMSGRLSKAEMALFAARSQKRSISRYHRVDSGRKPAKLITRDMVDSMKAGSVIVDCARAENSGNCSIPSLIGL